MNNLKEIGALNGIVGSGKIYTLSEIIQESYKAVYESKKLDNAQLTELVESHLAEVKSNPSDFEALSECLDIVKGVIALGESVKFEAEAQPATDPEPAAAPVNEAEKIDEVIVKKKKPRTHPKDRQKALAMKKAWKKNKAKFTKALKKFRNSSSGKAFYKALGKFNAKMSDGKHVTVAEAIDLFKAANSTMTHLAVELEHNPDFIGTFKECTEILSKDIDFLRECISKNEEPNAALVESFTVFSNILLESAAPEEDEDVCPDCGKPWEECECEDDLDEDDDPEDEEEEEDPEEDEKEKEDECNSGKK